MMRFEKRRQRENETVDKFLDDPAMLRRRSQPDESNRRINLAVASKFIDCVKNDEHQTILATHYKPLSTNAPTSEELRLKSKKYLLPKPPSRSGYYKNIIAILTMDQLNRAKIATNQRHGQETLLCKLQFDGPSNVSMPNLQKGHESDRLEPRG